jgi:hypothetical protein
MLLAAAADPRAPEHPPVHPAPTERHSEARAETNDSQPPSLRVHDRIDPLAGYPLIDISDVEIAGGLTLFDLHAA